MPPNEKAQTITQVLLQKKGKMEKNPERRPNLQPKVSDDPPGLQTILMLAIFLMQRSSCWLKEGNATKAEDHPRQRR